MAIERQAIRLFYALLVLATTTVASLRLYDILRVDGIGALKLAFLTSFTILFAWISASFWMVCFGAALRGRSALTGRGRKIDPKKKASRTAIVVPVHNEETGPLFAKLRAIYESVRKADALDAFDFYVLSDSTEPASWLAEEFAWFALRRDMGRDARVFYRHRNNNAGRKSGNIREFCENWGQHYEYMVVLDADSLMTGQTLMRLAGLMDAHPRTALIQVPPTLIGKDSVFARLQQFASSVYGPIYWAGLAFLQGPDGNYWGHNAILRVSAFMRHCGLPELSGHPPLGGEILSHDFVEAALLGRAGWQVWMAPELGGSYEEPPTSLLHHLVRDRRWCQGNLQHIRLIFARGFTFASRLHLSVGVMTYLSAPLWLLMLLVSAVASVKRLPPFAYDGKYPVLYWPMSHTIGFATLVGLAAALLYGQKLIAVLALMTSARARRAHGGSGMLLAGTLIESIISTLFAPIIMLSHVGYVAEVLLGQSTGWTAQQRGDKRTQFSAATRKFAPHTLAGLAAGYAAWHFTPGLLWWLTPVLAGPVLAIPLALLTSSPVAGRALRRAGLLVVPSEIQPLAIAACAGSRCSQAGSQFDPRLRVLEDPSARALHLTLLDDRADLSGQPNTTVPAGDPGTFSKRQWMGLLSDARALNTLARSRKARTVFE